MEENKKFIVGSINRICLELSAINQVLEKSMDENLIKLVSAEYPFPESIEELNCSFNAWKWSILEPDN